MKELSTEEKAKAYDNIIEKANKMHSENCEACQMCIEELIPELAESEDEKIRKAIVKYVSALEWRKIYGVTRDDMLAWLEKQGKNNMGISEATKQELKDNLNKALEKETPESWNEFLDEQGEQKPADKVEPDILIEESYQQQADDLIDMVTEKPAWSEEDETVLDNLIYALANDRIGNNRDEYVEYLKSLKDRVQSQNTWKPSGEQMKFLWKYAEQNNYDGRILGTLYNDLKKLRGE